MSKKRKALDKALSEAVVLNENKVPKDQKTQTYSKSISDFPSTTDALVWYLEGERKAASESKRQNDRFIGSMVPLLHPSVDDSELRSCLYTLRKIQDEMHKEVNHLLEMISTLNPADDQEAGRLNEADEDTCRSYNNAQAGNSRSGSSSSSNSRLFPGMSSSSIPLCPSTSAAPPDGVDISLLDRIGAEICGKSSSTPPEEDDDDDKLPDPSQFLAKGGGGDDDEGANASEKGEEEEGDMDYEGSTQELLANVDCLLTTDTGEGSSGSQDTEMSGIGRKNAYMSSYTSSYTINVTEDAKLLAEQAKERVLERAKGQNITATELRRQQISVLLDAGLTPSKVGALMDCKPRTIRKIIKMKEGGESLSPKCSGNSGRPRADRK